MIVKILIDGKEYGVNVYENNFDGEVQVNDTFHCEAEADGYDTIFGTNDQMITIRIGDDTIYAPQCKHNCSDCAGYETTGECNHGCWDCGHWDGSTCLNGECHRYGKYTEECAADCAEWEGGE